MTEYNVGDYVELINDAWVRVYIIYSITKFMWGDTRYTLWLWDEYSVYEWWQLKPHEKKDKVWFLTTN